MPAGRNCCWNQRCEEITKVVGKKECTITTALNLVNFYGPGKYKIGDISGAWGSAWQLPESSPSLASSCWRWPSCGSRL